MRWGWGCSLSSRFGVERLALDGQLDPPTLRHLAGNGMHMAAVGSVLLFALSMVVPVSTRLEHIEQMSPADIGQDVDDDDV